MSHSDIIRDSEPYFIIDPETRTIRTESSGNNILVQYDHNSERFTFEIPRYVDGHDMSACSDIRIHYRNTSQSNMFTSKGVYIPDDLAVNADNEDVITFSWLLSSATTQYIGFLHFSIQFLCCVDGVVEYAWNTSVYSDIKIIESLNNTEEAVPEIVDAIEGIKSDVTKEVEANLSDTLTEVDEAVSNCEAVAAALTLAKENGEFVGEKGDTGDAGVGIESIKKKSTDGLVDIYVITYTNGNTFQYEIANGARGADGVSATHSWDGTVLTITSASGTSSADLKGDKGDPGEKGESGVTAPVEGFFALSIDADGNLYVNSRNGEAPTFEYDDTTGDLYVVVAADARVLIGNVKGEKGEPGYTPQKNIDYFDGKDGTSVSVTSVSESEADGGPNVITFSDGQTLTVKNGNKGDDGTPATHSWDGTVLTIKSSSGTSSADLKGEKGEKGDPGNSNYDDLLNKPVIPSSVNAVEHQYAVSNSKDSISTVETWNGITSSLSQRERSCIFANGYYVVCGVGGEVGYSKDGVTWTTITPFVSGTLTNIAYGKGKFIIVDEFGSLWMAEETPISWAKVDVTFTSGIGSLTYANNRFVIAGDNMCAFSEDGIKWTKVEAPASYNQIAFGGGRYVAVGANGAVGVSYDGVTWVDRSNPDVTVDLRGVVYAKGRYIIGGLDGLIMYTEDFVTWGIATSDSAGVRYVRQITYAENKYYAATYTSAGAGEIWVSLDGITWTVQQQMTVRLWCLAYNDGKLITAGDSGTVYILDLGVEWQTKQAELSEGQYLWERIVFTLSDGGKVIGDSVCIKSAPSVETWTFTLADGSTVNKNICVN